MMSSLGNKKGFTLLEVIIVIGITGMVSAFMAPFLIINIQSSNAESDAKLLVSAIRSAQVKNKTGDLGKKYGIKLYTEKYSFFTGSSFATAESSYEVDLKNGNSISQILFSDSGTEVDFLDNSIRPVQSGSFTITNSGISYRIDINSEGLISYKKV